MHRCGELGGFWPILHIYGVLHRCAVAALSRAMQTLWSLRGSIEIFEYDLVLLGSAVIDWLPTKRMLGFLKKKLQSYSDRGKIVPSSPLIPGKYGLCFCTYAGPHIGKNEALPMTMWLSSFLEHLGYSVKELLEPCLSS